MWFFVPQVATERKKILSHLSTCRKALNEEVKSPCVCVKCIHPVSPFRPVAHLWGSGSQCWSSAAYGRESKLNATVRPYPLIFVFVSYWQPFSWRKRARYWRTFNRELRNSIIFPPPPVYPFPRDLPCLYQNFYPMHRDCDVRRVRCVRRMRRVRRVRRIRSVRRMRSVRRVRSVRRAGGFLTLSSVVFSSSFFLKFQLSKHIRCC